MHDHWTCSEKKAARVIYDRALSKARDEILTLHRNKEFTELGELWDYEREIREWREDLDFIFQYSYSKLHYCFAICLRRGWLRREDLSGLSEERIESLERICSL